MTGRPNNLQSSKSFTRMEPTEEKGSLSRSRSSTLQGQVSDILDPLRANLASDHEDGKAHEDIFTSEEALEGDPKPDRAVPDTFEDLPVEIRSLTER